ncbi:ATPase [Pseudonocardia sulfidoxydans NBRC 16205]|uniref:ATPase n=1 Tax=Pseudonocardia sulfidoxydans NBRC 16205 TaxID=1223511 RepID=A0A511DGI5_9PSEU|nr:SRPBCC family protein [Pseudonocardia sulfidoxydans]GEL23891.1 ATPase [Pseudonocardia sulfidoxydans NBRC 16205]
MDTSRKLQASKVIEAPADTIFALLSDPKRHVDLDDAGMVRGPEGDAPPIGGIGQVFTMNMHQDALGDYRMVNTVTAYQPGSRIGWAPAIDPSCDLASKIGDMNVSGHTFTYDLAETDEGTRVTQTYEWMSVHDEQFLAMFPVVSEKDLNATLDKIASAVS